MNKVLCLLTLALWVAPFACAPDDNIIDGVVKVINVIGKPSRLSTVFCGNVGKEYQLIRALSTINGSDQISISRLEGNSEYFKHFIVVDVALCDRSQLLSIFKDNPMGLAYSQWLLINSLNPFGTTDFNEIQDTFSQVDITQMSEVMFLTTESYKLKLCMVYKMERLRPGALIFEDFGYFPNFSLSHFIDTRVQTVTSMRRKNMQGLPLPMATVLDNLDSLNHFYDFVDVEIDPVAKSGHRLGVTVLQFMNATPELVVSRSWGIRNTTTGQWSGMMGDLISGRAEFGGTPSLLRSERAEIVEFLSISLESWTRIVFRAPKLSYTTNVYLMPFERSVWMASLALFATMTCLLLLSGICERKLTAAAGTKERPRIIDIAFVIFSAICNQGSSFNPLSVGGRIVLLSCLVLVVVLFVSYCAFIVVLLQSPATNIKTAQDVLNSRMQIGAEDTLYNRFWLKKLADPVEKTIYEKRITNKDGSTNFLSLEDGVRKIQQGVYAFHMETPLGYRIVSKLYDEGEKCDLREVMFANIAFPYATCRKNTPFREAFSVGMLRMKEAGVQRRIWSQVYQEKPKCTTRSVFSVLTIVDISPAIVILTFGVVLSLAILIVEIFLEKRRHGKAGGKG